MGMAVNQAGQHRLAVGIDRFSADKACRHIGAGTNRHNAVAVDGQRAVVQDASLRVHGDQGAMDDQQVNQAGCGGVGHVRLSRKQGHRNTAFSHGVAGDAGTVGRILQGG